MNRKKNTPLTVGREYWLGGIMSTLLSISLTIALMQQTGFMSWRPAEHDQTGLVIGMVVIIGAIGALNIWLLSGGKKAAIGLPALAIALGSVFVIPYGTTTLGMNAFSEAMERISLGTAEEPDAAACYVAAALLGFVISIGIWVVNQHLATRCVTAVVIFVSLMVLVFTNTRCNVFCLMLMVAYICYVVLQFCASRTDKQLAAQSGARTRSRHDSTYIAVCLIAAFLAAIIPSSPDPIPWGEIGQRLRDALSIDDMLISDEAETSILIPEGKLYTENEELAFVASPVVVGLTDMLTDVENHAVGTVYDNYDGAQWTASGVQTGAYIDDAVELVYFLSRNEVEDLSFLNMKKARLAIKNPTTDAAITFNKTAQKSADIVGSTMLNIGDNLSFFYFTDGFADENYEPEMFPVYSVSYFSLDWTDPQLISLLRNADGFRYSSSQAQSRRVSVPSELSSMLTNTDLVVSAQGYSSSLTFSRTFLEDSVDRAKLIRKQYTQLPELPERVRKLAMSIVGKTEGTYDRAQLLAGYLAANYGYTGEAPDVGMDVLATDVSGTDLTRADLYAQLITDGSELDLPVCEGDVVDSFLFETAEGTSAEFASALTVLLRSVGIPARYVEGYYVNNACGNAYYPSLPYKQVAVINKQAHAWVEYYIEGFGWIPIDPVPGFEYVSAATALDKYATGTSLYADHQEVALMVGPKTLSNELYSFGENHLVARTLDTFDGNAWTQGSTDYNDSTYYDALEFAHAMSRFTITTDTAFLFKYDITSRYQTNESIVLPQKSVDLSIPNNKFDVELYRGNLFYEEGSYTTEPEYSVYYLSVDWTDPRIVAILRGVDEFDYDEAITEGDQATSASVKALFDVLGIETLNYKNSTGKPDDLLLPDRMIPGGGKTEIDIYHAFDAEHMLDFFARRANDFDKRYTQLPKELSEQTAELALEVTADADNNYDKACALLEYLEANYAYTGYAEDVGVPEAYKQLLANPELEGDDLWEGIHVPAEDVIYNTESLLTIEPGEGNYVDRFLAAGEGDSTAFASAMTVLLRTLGIPARYVEGYYVNEMLGPDVYDRLEAFNYVVISQNEHAWVEVYFEGFGWVPFDPTPGFEYVSQYTTNKSLYGAIEQEQIIEAQQRLEEERAQESRAKLMRTLIIVAICVFVLAIALVIAVPNIQRALRRRRMVSGRKLEYTDRLGLRLVDDTMCELALGGLARNADETIIAYCDRVCQELWLSENIRLRLAAAIRYMDELCYSTEIRHRVKPMALRFLYNRVRHAVNRNIGFFKRCWRFISFNHWTQEKYSILK